MDSVTLTVLVILSFLLVWLGIMIFTTKPEEEEEEKEVIAEENEEKSKEKNEEKNEDAIEKYEKMIAELEEKIKNLEAKPTNDKLLDWLADLRRENEFLKMKMSQLGNMGLEPYNEPYKYENDKMREELEEYKKRVKNLEDDLAEMKNNLNYYRIMVNRLQGRYTIINKYNYRMCIRNPETGEYQYELVKLPQDFDPFNPTYITKDGIEVYEEYGLRIPTKLGDIIRENYKKDMYLKDLELGR